MPICNGCGVSYDDKFQFCPYCGRETPKLQVTEVLIKDVIPANACPICQRNDRAEKVSVIYKGGRQETSMSIPVMNVSTHSDGRIYSTTSNENVNGLNETKLAQELCPPPRPEYKKPVGFLGYLTMIGLFGFIPFFCVLAVIDLFGAEVVMLIYVGLFAVVAISVYLSIQDKKKDVIEKAAYISSIVPAWERSMEKWRSLYFCYRDGVVFIPGENSSAPLERMADIIN